MILFPEFAKHYKINVFVMIFEFFHWTPITGTANTDVFLGPLSLARQIPTFSLDPYHWHCKYLRFPWTPITGTANGPKINCAKWISSQLELLPELLIEHCFRNLVCLSQNMIVLWCPKTHFLGLHSNSGQAVIMTILKRNACRRQKHVICGVARHALFAYSSPTPHRGI